MELIKENKIKFLKYPFIISQNKWEDIINTSQKIFNIANKKLLDILCEEKNDSWIEDNYGCVKSFWKNNKNGINIMRIDFAWDINNNLKVLELNTACPGGWIISGEIEKIIQADKCGKTTAPDQYFFSKYLLKELGNNIIIITMGYKFEADLLKDQIINLGGNCKVIDPLVNDVQEILKFKATGLYWEIDSLKIIEHINIIRNIYNLQLKQISSFGSLLISENKSFLNILKYSEVKEYIPDTYIMTDDFEKNISFINKDKAILKPSNLWGGTGVIIGKYCNDEEWIQHIKNAMKKKQTVIQELCYLRKTNENMYGDICVFVVDGNVIGATSRVSTNMITNVVNGEGYSQSVVINNNQNDLILNIN